MNAGLINFERYHKSESVKNPFDIGTQKSFRTTVTEEKLARFDAGLVHPVYSTFSLGKDVEWACRLFVLEMKEEGEEGVGSYLSIEHLSPAPLDSEVEITATLTAVNGNEVVCSYEVISSGRLIATGIQKQRIVNAQRFQQLIQKLQM